MQFIPNNGLVADPPGLPSTFLQCRYRNQGCNTTGTTLRCCSGLRCVLTDDTRKCKV